MPARELGRQYVRSVICSRGVQVSLNPIHNFFGLSFLINAISIAVCQNLERAVSTS